MVVDSCIADLPDGLHGMHISVGAISHVLACYLRQSLDGNKLGIYEQAE